MPRNASGVYSLPSGNPVVTNTPIATNWGNGTMSDIASELSNSLDRDGRGRMRVPFLVLDGSAPAPTLSFVNEAGTGFFRAGAGQLGLAILGSLAALFTSTGIAFTGNTTLTGDISVTGDVAVGDDLTVVDDATVGGDLGITGALVGGSSATLPAETTIGTVSAAEIAFLTNVTSDIQAQINGRVLASASQAWGGVQDFTAATSILVPTQGPTDNTTKAASTAFVQAIAFQAALPAQSASTINKVPISNGTVAAWGSLALVRTGRTSNTIFTVLDGGKYIDITANSVTQTVDPVASLGDQWEIYLGNSSTSPADIVTFTPTGGEFVDGLASIAMYTGEIRRIFKDGAGFKSIIVQAFKLEPTASLAFKEPPGYRGYEVYLAPPGGGGGSGRRGAAGSTRGGGGAGGAGATAWAIIMPGAPGANIAVTVGANGVGGAAVTADNTDGNPGTAGGAHSFGTLLSAQGGLAGAAGAVGSASGGAASATPGAMIGSAGTAGGTAGQPPVAGTSAATWAPTGGGGGANITSGNVAYDGAAAGASGTGTAATQLAGGIAGTSAGTRDGGDGNISNALRGGTGGGGGASHLTLAGGSGGVGKRGGGGGGGGGSTNGVNSGAGSSTTGYYLIRGIF